MGEAGKSERTVYAEDRTALANERTYSAWLRTGLGSLAAGAAVERVLGGELPPWATKGAAVALIVAAIAAFWTAFWRYTHLGPRLREAKVRRVPNWTALAMACALTASGLLVLAGVLLSAPSG